MEMLSIRILAQMAEPVSVVSLCYSLSDNCCQPKRFRFAVVVVSLLKGSSRLTQDCQPWHMPRDSKSV